MKANRIAENGEVISFGDVVDVFSGMIVKVMSGGEAHVYDKGFSYVHEGGKAYVYEGGNALVYRGGFFDVSGGGNVLDMNAAITRELLDQFYQEEEAFLRKIECNERK